MVRALPRFMQGRESPRRADPGASEDAALGVGDALLNAPVVIGVVSHAERLGTADECVAKGTGFIVSENGRRLILNPLILREGRYEMDFEDLERLASDPCAKMLFLLVRERLSRIGEVDLIEPEGRFLLWLDFRKLDLASDDLTRFLRTKAGWAIARGPASRRWGR